ncbi:MAG: hypothetical protein ACRCZW_13195 [Lactobacillaceae bacterium]
MKKDQYLPKIIADLKTNLTPLAKRNSLSKNLSPLYLQITSITVTDIKVLGMALV